MVIKVEYCIELCTFQILEKGVMPFSSILGVLCKSFCFQNCGQDKCALQVMTWVGRIIIQRIKLTSGTNGGSTLPASSLTKLIVSKNGWSLTSWAEPFLNPSLSSTSF